MKIVIASGKGGTGKTTLSTNISSYLSKTRKVILADLDVEEPNSSIFIKGEIFLQEKKYKMIPVWDKDKCTLCNSCQENCNFNSIMRLGKEILVFPELCHSCYACSELCPDSALPMKPKEIGEMTHFKSSNIDFIESRLNIGEEQAVPLISQTLKYVDSVKNRNDLVLFDSPPGTSCSMIEVAKNADRVFLVTEATPFGLNDLRIAVETVELLDKPLYVIINRVGNEFDGVEKYCDLEEIEIISSIPEDREIATLYSQGELIIDKHNAFTEEIKKICYKIEEMEGK